VNQKGISIMESITNKWQTRIEKRRNEGQNVLRYVDQIIQANHATEEDVIPFLTSDEMQELKNIVAERAKLEAEARARAEANRLEQERKHEENERLRAAFWEKNFPLPLTIVPDIQTESELFDVLARYRIVKVEYSVERVNYHWDEFVNIEDSTIQAWLPSDIEIDLETELPGDENEEVGIGKAIHQAIKELASERATEATEAGRLQEGTVVIFDVPGRRICLDATVEVTRDESFEKAWSPDDT
jgi:hypothetical protein